MNAFNRIVLVILILLLLAVSVALLIAPIQTLQIGVGALQAVESNLRLTPNYYLFYMIILAVLALLFLVVLYLEVRRTRKKSVDIRTDGQGRARIGVESVIQSLEYRIDEIPGVRDVRPHVISRGRDVKVIIDLHTSPTVNIPTVTGQITDLAHEIIEEQLGVKIHGKVEVNVSHEPFPRGTLPPGSSRSTGREEEAPDEEAAPVRPRREPHPEPETREAPEYERPRPEEKQLAAAPQEQDYIGKGELEIAQEEAEEEKEENEDVGLASRDFGETGPVDF